NQARVDVAVDVFLGALGMANWEMFLGVEIHAARVRTHGHEVIEAVPVVDVQIPRDWSQTVRRIKIAIPLGVMSSQPKPVAVIPDLQVTGIVLVGAFGVDQFAQES